MIYPFTQPSHLDARTDFLPSTGPSCTLGTVKGNTQAKISYGAKITSGVYGYALSQAREVGGL